MCHQTGLLQKPMLLRVRRIFEIQIINLNGHAQFLDKVIRNIEIFQGKYRLL